MTALPPTGSRPARVWDLVRSIILVVLLVRRRLAFWVPLGTAAFAIGALVVGFAIAVSGVPGTTL
ncbi:MAG: hypothetical protein JWP66_561 [Naasia sp.]|nr:hypothetical protein [Naasia sp.]